MQNRSDTQRQWNNSDQVHVFRVPAEVADSRKYLVFVSTPADVGFAQDFLHEPNRSFDIAVRYYAQPGEHDPLFTDADYVLSGGLSKYHSARQFLIKLDLVDRYDGFLFLDGDLKFGLVISIACWRLQQPWISTWPRPRQLTIPMSRGL